MLATAPLFPHLPLVPVWDSSPAPLWPCQAVSINVWGWGADVIQVGQPELSALVPVNGEGTFV